MTDIRCQCGKILCQREEYVIIIKCRHCKRTLNIDTRKVEKSKEQVIAAKQIMYKPKVAVSI